MSKIIFGQLGKLKRDKIEEYESLHANPWPDVLKTIHNCNLRNYSIFRHDDLVFAYFEYVGVDLLEKIRLQTAVLSHIGRLVGGVDVAHRDDLVGIQFARESEFLSDFV